MASPPSGGRTASVHPARYRQNKTLNASGHARAQIKNSKVKMEFARSKNAWRDHLIDDSVNVLGPVFDGDHPYVVQDDFENFKAAVNKRINYRSDVTADPCVVTASYQLLDEKIPEKLNDIEWTYELFEEWNANNDPAKQVAMVAAIDSFMRYTDKEFGRKEIFAKCELLLKRHTHGEWAGRIVNASSDLHNALSGPILVKCLKRLNALLDDRQKGDVSCYIQYAKDSTYCSERLDRARTESSFVVEADFSSNDMMQCSDVQPLEGAWLSRLGAPKWLIDIMERSNVYMVSSRKHDFKATVHYQLPSGSTSTTFRNSIWNMSIFRAWQNKHAVKGVAFFLGDDMIVVVTSSVFPCSKRGRKHASRSYEHVAKLARMKAKVKVHTHLMGAEFLSKNFVPSAEFGHLMIPKIGKAMGRFNVRANNNASLSDDEYMAGKSLSFAWEFRFCPEIGDLMAERAGRTGVNLPELSLEAFSYNFRKEVERVGSIKDVLRATVNSATLDWYDMENFCSIRYRMSWDSVLEAFTDIVLGSDDLDEIVYGSLATIDYW
jgi:hypothetical protein